MLSLITNSVLDVSFGIAWWVTSKTINGMAYGIQYIIYGNEKTTDKTTDNTTDKTTEKLDLEQICMSDFKFMLDSKNDEINKLNNKLLELEEKIGYDQVIIRETEIN